jgi:hypothetical protein
MLKQAILHNDWAPRKRPADNASFPRTVCNISESGTLSKRFYERHRSPFLLVDDSIRQRMPIYRSGFQKTPFSRSRRVSILSGDR